jgi:hypothetical protein
MEKFLFKVIAWLYGRYDLPGVSGVHREENYTWFECALSREDKSNPIVATSTVAGSKLVFNNKLTLEFQIPPYLYKREGRYVEASVVCAFDGQCVRAKFVREENLLTQILPELALVRVKMGYEAERAVFHKEWEIFFWTMGKNNQGQVEISEQRIVWDMDGLFWPELSKYYNMIGVATAKFPTLAEMIGMIKKNISTFCLNKERKEQLLLMAPVMAVTFLRACGQNVLLWQALETETPQEPSKSAPSASSPKVKPEAMTLAPATAETSKDSAPEVSAPVSELVPADEPAPEASEPETEEAQAELPQDIKALSKADPAPASTSREKTAKAIAKRLGVSPKRPRSSGRRIKSDEGDNAFG